ncbi:MAG: CinA family protein, partial [Dehalococcoidia bacterium]|nr:CinA family protein [Dehalococcoidia bacterium]
NPLGTAPGWFVERDGRILIAMPGVPREMTRMWEQEAVPRLKARGVGGVLLTRILKIAGKGESAVEQAVAPFLKSTNPTIATYAKNDGIHLRLTAKAADRATAERLLADFEAQVRPLVADDVYGVDDETLGGVIAALLADRSIALADTLTGGAFAQFLTSDPGLARRFVGGLVAATPTVPWATDAGPPGAIETAVALARLARDRFRATVGVGLTGVTDPDSTDETPPGAFAIAVDDGTRVVRQRAFRSSAPAEIRRWASYTAENLLWRALAGRPLPS